MSKFKLKPIAAVVGLCAARIVGTGCEGQEGCTGTEGDDAPSKYFAGHWTVFRYHPSKSQAVLGR